MQGEKAGPTTILVVDDEPITMEIITTLLKDSGYHVLCAGDGRQCLDIAKISRVDLILMDVVMPKMNGLEACSRLRQNPELAQIPVVFVTASADDETLENAFRVGGRDYVRKPIGRIELLTRIERVLEQQRTLYKLAEDEKLKGVLETAGGVCHKLNQPLQYLLGAVQIMMMNMVPEDPIYENLDTMRLKIEQMGEITRKLAEITRYRTTAHAGQEILDIDGSTEFGA